jgi:cytochrome c oxidase subunit 2
VKSLTHPPLTARRLTRVQGIVAATLVAAVTVPLTVYALDRAQVVEVHARIAEAGGWSASNLTATVGEPLRLRLVSDDMPHGFAVGQTGWPEIELKPNAPMETTLVFERPGRYTYYCTRWCGMGHWRMRGTIEVTAAGETPGASIPLPPDPPLYVQLGIDLDAGVETPASIVPTVRPSASRSDALAASIPEALRSQTAWRSQSPADLWRSLRKEGALSAASDAGLWDMVAHVWQAQTTPERVEEGRALYAANCAVCHGDTGGGDGIAEPALTARSDAAQAMFGHMTMAPTDFTDAVHMLSLSPARLQGKIIRGGMGTGMPFWGPIFTEAQSWALTDFLWTFQFDH